MDPARCFHRDRTYFAVQASKMPFSSRQIFVLIGTLVQGMTASQLTNFTGGVGSAVTVAT